MESKVTTINFKQIIQDYKKRQEEKRLEFKKLTERIAKKHKEQKAKKIS